MSSGWFSLERFHLHITFVLRNVLRDVVSHRVGLIRYNSLDILNTGLRDER